MELENAALQTSRRVTRASISVGADGSAQQIDVKDVSDPDPSDLKKSAHL